MTTAQEVNVMTTVANDEITGKQEDEEALKEMLNKQVDEDKEELVTAKANDDE